MLDRRFLFRATVALVAALASGHGASAADLWSEHAAASLPARGAGALELPLPHHFRAFDVDVAELSARLSTAPQEGSGRSPLVFAIPFPDGSERLFAVESSSILEPELQAKFPEVRTFIGQGIDDPTATARLSLTSLGFHAMVLSAAGTVYVSPYRRWDSRTVLAYYKKDARRPPDGAFHCDVEEDALAEVAPPVPAAASGTQLRTYRLAVAATGEYSVAVCAPNPVAVACAMNAIVVSMNRVDGIYEREVAVRMVLVANNNLIVYTNGATDPYTNGNGSTMLGQNQTNINAVIGTANYDIGHVFSTGGGGVANLQVPCTSSKARGVTGRGLPIGDDFDVDYVAHEMGHQFGGNHTFNGTTNNCGGGNRSASAAYEPGSGTTIMAYAGICGAEDLQPHSDDTFHTKSFDEIVAFSTGTTGNACAVVTATGNGAPTVNAGASYTIPKQTPFTLTGSATDPDGDALTYMWEEFDLGTAAPPNDDVAASRPIFRPFVPLTVPSRTFPQLSDILNNVATLGESMSTRNRTMTFRLTARDNRAGGSGVNYASTTVTVNATAGPFLVTQPNTALSWPGNSSQTITWDVAGTTAAPVSCANVAVDLSTDGGNTFPTALSASTANDGSEALTIPNLPTTQARIRVSCVGNIFFDISNTNFTILASSGNPPPVLTSILPTVGPISGGTSVALTGTDFVSGASVLFGAVASPTVTFNSATSITAVAPAQAAGTVSVTVTNPDAQSSTLNAAFTYTPPPVLTSILPTAGPITGGTPVTLTGTGFTNGATVLFGAVASPTVTWNSSTSISAVSPAQAAGTVSLTVTNPDLQSSTLNSAFTYSAAGFYSLAPCRIVDTRNANGPLGGPALVGGVTRTFAIAGSCGVPAGALAVALNITVVSPTSAGYLNVYPAGMAPPNAWTIAFGAGQTRANNSVAGLFGPTAGSVAVFNGSPAGSTVHLIVDVTGYLK